VSADITQLAQETAKEMGATPLDVKVDNIGGVETDGRSFFYNPSALEEIGSAAGDDGLRFVVAHELGHQMGGMYVGGQSGEFMADDYAARALARSGGDIQAISGVFSVVDESPTHPAPVQRDARARAAYRDESKRDIDMDVPINKPVGHKDVGDLAI
jgi:hypothetical protein